MHNACNVAIGRVQFVTMSTKLTMTKAAAKRKHGSLYRIAQVLGVNRSTVGRWGRNVPARYVQQLLDTAGVQ